MYKYKLTPKFKQLKEEQSSESQKYQIYCDMDGVLVDFDKQFEKIGKMPPRQFKDKYGTPKFWELIDKAGHEFWSEMEWMPNGKQLWDYIKKYNPILLSAPSKDHTSRYGKKLWIQNNLPGVKLILAERAKKVNYVGKNHILIDDYKKTIDEWVLAGGIGILFESTQQTINDLKTLNL